LLIFHEAFGEESDDAFEKEVWVDVSSMLAVIFFWRMTLTDSGHGQQLHQPDGQGHLYCWGKPFSIFFRFFFSERKKLEERKKMRSSSCTL